MSSCTFFGHRDCYGLHAVALQTAIENLIDQEGVDTFYVGNQGKFDSMVYTCLKNLQMFYPHIRFSVVLAYLPSKAIESIDMADTVYPLIKAPPKFAIERRNRFMIEQSDFCICYIDHRYGGAYKFAKMAERHGLKTIHLGTLNTL